ncbi:aspartate kinase [Ruminococcus sp.]|uniref:aspartate kinase n=1 Tax=Ruminococcus sp. TaxID=41978 RepID=UPI00388DF841
MSLIVMKFGGTSVKDAERIRNVAGIVTDSYKKGNSVVVVVSAQGDTTDDLIEKAAEITANPTNREMDMLVSSGEQISASLLAMCIQDMGYPAISLTGWQAGFLTSSSHSAARIRQVYPDRIRREIDQKKIVVVCGFQGVSRYDDITTLGRGGSDTSAVAIAAVLHADLCQIYTDVEGVFTADPRKVENAKKLDEISYDEMLELATLGAQVLNNRSVEMAKKYNIELEVLSSYTKVPGTIVKEKVKMEKMLISGVAVDKDVARLSITCIPDKPGMVFKLFSKLAARKINVDVILQSVGRDETKDIAFTVAKNKGAEAKEICENFADTIGAGGVDYDDDIAKVSIVGAGMESHAGVASKMFEALYDRQINIRMISTSEIKVSVIINKDDADRAVSAIHEKFFPSEK